MAHQTTRIGRTHSASGQRDRLEYRALVAISFVPCLVYTAFSRASGSAAITPGSSVFADALSSARAAVGYAYLA